ASSSSARHEPYLVGLDNLFGFSFVAVLQRCDFQQSDYRRSVEGLLPSPIQPPRVLLLELLLELLRLRLPCLLSWLVPAPQWPLRRFERHWSHDCQKLLMHPALALHASHWAQLDHLR